MLSIMAVPLTVAGRVFCTFGSSRCITTSALLCGRGIKRVARSLKLQKEEVQEMKPEDLEAMADVSFDTFNEYVSQIDGDAMKYQNKLRHKTIHHKYFKVLGPKEENLLTWSMKEQLKYLHSSDPDRWTPEVLSKSFPISPEGVQRLIKSHWIPKSEAERQQHDQAVVARWRIYLRGHIGSFKLLEKALNNKFVPEKLPAPVMDMKDMLSMLEGLRFDGEEHSVAKHMKKRNKLPRQPKMQGKSFSSIIEDYEVKSSGEKLQGEENTGTNNVNVITGPPRYEGSYTQISGANGAAIRRLPAKKSGRLMTFREFMEKKT